MHRCTSYINKKNKFKPQNLTNMTSKKKKFVYTLIGEEKQIKIKFPYMSRVDIIYFNKHRL